MFTKPPAVIACDKREAFAQGSASDEAIHSCFVAMDCFAEPVIGRRFAPTRWLAMTETTIDRHPEVAASSAALEGRRRGSVILRGAQVRAPPAMSALRSRGDDAADARARAWLETLAQAA
jgi:hypothetical protein